MGVEKIIDINERNIVSLKKILGDDGKEDYEYLKACVEVYLLSKISDRKNMALIQLRNYFPNANIHEVKEGNITSAYISPTKDQEVFLFIEKYIIPEADNTPEAELLNQEILVVNKLNNN